MRIFNLAKIDSGPEKQSMAEVGGTNKITKNNKNNILNFILFVMLYVINPRPLTLLSLLLALLRGGSWPCV